MKKSNVIIAGILMMLLGTTTLFAQNSVQVGGEAMNPKMDIIDNAVNSADHTTLVAAVKAAGLVETLKGAGPFTVFAPDDDAFENLPDGTVESLLEKQNINTLTKVLTYHVVSGAWDAKAIKKLIQKGEGKAEIVTVSGGKLWAMMNGDQNIMIKDEKGGIANISVYDVYQSNGVIHVIDYVLMPR